MITKTTCFAGATALATFAAPSLFAQGATAPEDTGAIAEVVVTAQKRSENAQNVPISLTALGSEEIAASGVTNTEDLRSAVPALNVTRGAGGFGLPRIRGVGATGQGNGIENPVAVYVDGVYYAAASGVLQSLFDVEQVAVLKGPQGTLFGRNATGGLIQITTLDPSLTEAKGKAEIGYGNYQTSRAAGFLSIPVSETFAFSLSGQYENRGEGFGTNVFTGNDIQDARNFAGRAKLLFQPSSATRILLSADINGTNDSYPAFVNFGLNTVGQNVPDVVRSLGGDPDYDIYADVDPEMTARQRGASLTVSHDFSVATFKSISAYRSTDLTTLFDPDGTVVPTLRIRNSNRDRTFTQELDLISNGDQALQWALGAFYMTNKAGQYPGRTTGVSQFGGNGFNDEFNEVKLDSLSGFLEGSYPLGDATKLTAGLRYTTDDRTLNATRVGFNGATNVTTTVVSPEQSRTFNKLTYKLSLDHRFSDELMAYASYNRGFRAGTFVPQATPVIVLEPEVLDAFEVGVKSDLFDRRVRLNVAGYYYDQSSVQVQQVIAGVNSVYSAKDGAKIYGVDGDVTWQASDNLRLFGGFSWNQAKYRAFTDAIISIPFPLAASTPPFSTTRYSYLDSVTGQTIANTACLGTFVPANITTQAARDAFYRSRTGGNCLLRGDATGNSLQNSPEWTFSLGGSFDIPSSIGKFSLAGNIYYNDGYVGTADERVVQKDFTTANASLTWHDKRDALYVRLWGNNLTDAYYRSQIGATNSGDNGTAGTPRTYGITVGYGF